MTTTHPFEHLGPAPYRYLGTETADDRAAKNQDRAQNGLDFTANLCGGTCDHCGTAIFNVFRFRAADGAEFKVGCECAQKGLAKFDPARYAFDRDRRKAELSKRHAREAAKLAEADAWIGAHADELRALPHPTSYRAERGETLLDSLAWYWDNAGTTGKLKAYRGARKALAS